VSPLSKGVDPAFLWEGGTTKRKFNADGEVKDCNPRLGFCPAEKVQ